MIKKISNPGSGLVVLLDIVEDWTVFQTWRDVNGDPRYDYLGELFGDVEVPVTNCGDGTSASRTSYGDAHGQRQMTAREFFAWAARTADEPSLFGMSETRLSCVAHNNNCC